MKQILIGYWILLIAVMALCFIYQYPAIWHLLPQGSHMWRQADCLAMTQNYQQFHLPLFQPATYNLESVNGKVVGEFPLFYFIAAQFNNTAFALRLIHSIVFLAGILSTYFIAFYFLQRRYLAIVCSLLLFTSPLLVFYGNNFLSDIPALSIAFIGWAIFLYAYQKEKLIGVVIAFAFFTFAALLKASEAINLAIVFYIILKTKDEKSNFKFTFLLSICCGLIIFKWYAYAKSYNLQNHDTYYFLNVFPIWKLSVHDIGLGIWRMTGSLNKNYFWRPTSFILLVSCYFLFRHWRKLDLELRWIIAASFLSVFVYILLFYQKMIGHEYYYTPFFIFVLFGIIGLLKTYNFFHAENVFGHALLFLFLIPNIIFCRNFVAEKLTDNLPNGYLSSTEMQDFLVQHGVTEDKTLISLPDDSPNKTLSQLKRKGYTDFNNYSDVLRNKQADFLIITINTRKHQLSLNPYLQDSIGDFHGIVLYKLR